VAFGSGVTPRDEASLVLSSHRRSVRAALLLLGTAALVHPSKSAGQDLARPLSTEAIDESRIVTLPGSVHPLAQKRFDQGPVVDSFAADRMLLMLNRPAEREAALRQFLIDAHSRGSSRFHKWVTPEQFGERFGPADSDIQAATRWLSSHGFRVGKVTKSRSLIEFSGSARNVKETFHSEIHKYRVSNETHYANANNLAIPEALGPLIRGVSPINDFHLKSYARRVGPASYSRRTGKATPLLAGATGIGSYFTIAPAFFAVSPEDFATQYNLTPLYQSGGKGLGQTIGIIGGSNINLALTNAYRQLFHLSGNGPRVVIDGGDPGIGPLPDSDVEAYLDVELSGAVAPDAAVNLYISDGSQVQDPINLATIRAIEDNEASVLSLSLGACEAVLGPFGNQLWASLWEQAAAQGQTVLVSSGDTGSAGCGFADENTGTQGLAVSGVASTPWNVAVGGTDFFYPNYANGPSSADPFWNQANDSNNGSLIAPLAEQAWDVPFGLNILESSDSLDSLDAAGGGASSCVQSTIDPTGHTVCFAGYPKPAWQGAPGVPADGVRDLPDVSLFAANGPNLSTYAICAGDTDCAATSGNEPQVTLIGGTSASAPAMAGIMALVNQKFGRHGQADFNLYALARKNPAVFHDIVTGTNNVPCQQGTTDCSLDTNGDGRYSLQEYAAGPGYDLATGLGSVDANALVTNWDDTSFVATTTSLSLSSSSIVHGTPVTFTASVAAPSGSGTPTGDVAVTTNSGFPLQRDNAIPITSGTASSTVDFFPGGTYQVGAQYQGDGVFGPSTSAPVQISVAPEPSTIFFEASGPNGIVTNSGAQTTYGERWTFTAEPYGMNGDQIFGLATGSVTFTDGATSQQAPMNSQGVAAYSPSALALGTHSIAVSYAGDASYQASTAGPFTFTVAQGTPRILIPTVDSSIPVGGNLLVTVVIGTGFGTAPTGNITLSLGTTMLVVPLTPISLDTFPYSSASVTFTNLQGAGSFPLTVSYGGDSNWTSATTTYRDSITVTASTLSPTTTSISVFPTSISRFESSSFTATVRSASGSGPAPTGTVLFYVNGQALPSHLEQNGQASTDPVPATAMTNGINQVIAVYTGDSVYNPSTSTSAAVTVDLGTFSLTLGVPRIAIPAGQSATVPVLLNAIDGFSALLALSCAPSSGSIGCGVNPATTTAAGTTAATLTINAYTLTGGETVPLSTAPPPGIPLGAVTSVGLLLLVVLACAARPIPVKWRLAWSFCAFGVLLAGCGGGSSNPSSSPPPVKTPAAPGSYSVLVNASAKGTIRNVNLIVVVQ
jgi:hypothetical protein